VEEKKSKLNDKKKNKISEEPCRPPVREGHRRRGDNSVKTRVPTGYMLCARRGGAIDRAGGGN